MKKLLQFLLVLIIAGCTINGQDDQWIELFDGETLDGWSIHSGSAEYRVEDGAIVGNTVKGSPNTFLCTDQEYGDFVLEFEVLLDPGLNSGVQFRSSIAPEELTLWLRNNDGEPEPRTIPEDRVYGYQVEIADNGSAGGIYDEARRRGISEWWVEEGSEKSKAFKDEEWNQYRVECDGQSIKTWVNGMMIADIKDAMTSKGIIGLQVHSVPDDAPTYEVRWRNIRLKPLD